MFVSKQRKIHGSNVSCLNNFIQNSYSCSYSDLYKKYNRTNVRKYVFVEFFRVAILNERASFRSRTLNRLCEAIFPWRPPPPPLYLTLTLPKNLIIMAQLLLFHKSVSLDNLSWSLLVTLRVGDGGFCVPPKCSFLSPWCLVEFLHARSYLFFFSRNRLAPGRRRSRPLPSKSRARATLTTCLRSD